MKKDDGIKRGLEGVEIAESGISYIDGDSGLLTYRGINIFDLAEYSTFEEVAFLLMYGRLPLPEEADDFMQELISERPIPTDRLSILLMLPRDYAPMAMLRTLVSYLPKFNRETESVSSEAIFEKALYAIAKFPTLVAGITRHLNGYWPLQPLGGLGHAANFLWMMTGREPTELEAKIMDVAMILHAEHGINASTFTAMVTVSSLSDFVSGLTAAIGSLKGPLHGGANRRVMEMLFEIGWVDNVEPYIMDKLERGDKVMGFGHRVYKTMDPRATILKKYSQKLAAQDHADDRWLRISEKVEEVMAREVGSRGIYPNVDFYSATVYHYLGIPADVYTAIFAACRIAGWSAHILEQYDNNRIFRPRARYNGLIDVPYVPLEQRMTKIEGEHLEAEMGPVQEPEPIEGLEDEVGE